MKIVWLLLYGCRWFGYDEKRREMYGSGIFGEFCDLFEIGDIGYGGIFIEKMFGGEG